MTTTTRMDVRTIVELQGFKIDDMARRYHNEASLSPAAAATIRTSSSRETNVSPYCRPPPTRNLTPSRRISRSAFSVPTWIATISITIMVVVLLVPSPCTTAFVVPNQRVRVTAVTTTTSPFRPRPWKSTRSNAVLPPTIPQTQPLQPLSSSSTTTTALSLSISGIPEPLTNFVTCALQSTTAATGGLSTLPQVPLTHAFAVNAVLFFVLRGKLLKMLTINGFANAVCLGILLWTTLGYQGWALCVAFLVGGQLVTKVKFAEKQARGIAEKRGGRRGPENLWGSAATGLVCALCASYGYPSLFGVSSNLFVLGYVASLATKLADTFASEIGKAYGKTTFLITTLERVPPGTEGAISAEGTLAALVGGLLLSAMAWWPLGLISGWKPLVISTMAAFWATNVESLLGATVQEKKGLEWMTNEVINFLNTLIGAALAIVTGKLFLG